MKYPQEQYAKLVENLKEISKYAPNIKDMNPSALHYQVYQNHGEGLDHNRMMVNESGEIARKWRVEDNNLSGYKLIIEQDKDFVLYPDGCNDNHIETAVKKALKEIF